MEREVGGGMCMGNTCKSLAVSFQCMTKFTTNKKKKEEEEEASHAIVEGICRLGESPFLEVEMSTM